MSRPPSSRRCFYGSVLVALAVAMALALTSRPARAADARVSFGPTPAWVRSIEPSLAEGADGAKSSNGQRYLLLDQQLRLRDGAVARYVHWAKRIVNEAGLQAASQVAIDFDPSYETVTVHSLVIRRDGRTLDRRQPASFQVLQREPRLEQQIYDERRSVVSFISDLRVGDVVEWSWSVVARDPTLAGRLDDVVYLGGPDSIARIHARVLMPLGRSLELAVHAPPVDGSLPPTVSNAPGGTEYEWDRRDVAAYPLPEDTPSDYSPIPFVQLTDFHSWEEVARWGSSLFQPATIDTATVRQRVEAWQAAGLDASALALAAARFVQDEIRYVGIEVGMGRRRPSAPAIVLARRFGDCKDKAALLVGLLRTAGIDAAPALVSSTLRRHIDEWIPSPSVFDHAIVRVGPIDGTTYWIDPTVVGRGGGLERDRFSSIGRALVLTDGTRELQAVPEATLTEPSFVIEQRFGVPAAAIASEARLDVTRTYTGTLGDAMRMALRTQPAQEISKVIAKQYERVFPKLRESAPIEQGDDREANRVTLVTHFVIPEFWSSDTARRMLVAQVEPVTMEGVLERPSIAARMAPLSFGHPVWTREELVMTLPVDWLVTSEHKDISAPAFDFTFASDYADRRLTYRFEVYSRRDTVGVDQFEKHVQAIDAARALMPRTLTWRVASTGWNWWAIAGSVLALPLLGLAAIGAYRWEPTLRASPADEPPLPIGGALLFVAFRLAVLPFVIGKNMVPGAWIFALRSWELVAHPASNSPNHPALAWMTVIEELVFAGAVLWGIVLTVLFLQRRRAFVPQFTAFTIAFDAFTIIDHIVASTLVREPQAADNVMPTILTAVIVDVMILVYVRTSVRATATFTRTRRPKST